MESRILEYGRAFVNSWQVSLVDGCLQISFCRFHVHFSEVFHQQAVDEDISATDAAQEDQVNAVVEEGDEFVYCV
jgi:hypothetical protein